MIKRCQVYDVLFKQASFHPFFASKEFVEADVFAWGYTHGNSGGTIDVCACQLMILHDLIKRGLLFELSSNLSLIIALMLISRECLYS